MNALASVMCVVSFSVCASGISCWDGGFGAGVRGGGFLRAIERIHHQHRVARFGKPFGHLAECRPQPEDIRPHENAGGGAAGRMHEVAIGGAVRSGHVHVRFGHRDRVGHLRQQHGHACSQHGAAELLSCHQTERFVLFPVLLKMILIAHVRSLSFVLVRTTAAYRDIVYHSAVGAIITIGN